jgi:hypothetical protein
LGNRITPHSITPTLHCPAAPPLRSAVPVRVEADRELGSHFQVICDTGEVAEVSWSFIRATAGEVDPRTAGEQDAPLPACVKE